MEPEFSKPLSELPAFLSTISMVVDDRAAIVQQLVQAERKSPPIYAPARDLFIEVLEGNFSFEGAFTQALRLSDVIERRCATEILSVSERYLRRESHCRVRLFPRMDYFLPNGMPLDVTPMWLRHSNPSRLMILHFWQTPLSSWQLSAAAAVIRSALLRQHPQYSACEIDFISASLSPYGPHRRFEQYNWSKLKPLGDDDLRRFWKQFLTAWSEYQHRPPREIRRTRAPGLFDKWPKSG